MYEPREMAKESQTLSCPDCYKHRDQEVKLIETSTELICPKCNWRGI